MNNGVDLNKIKNEQICVDPSIYDSVIYLYGWYLKEEVDSLNETCSNFGLYKVILISLGEYYGLSSVYVDKVLLYEGKIGDSVNNDKIAKLSGIDRLKELDAAQWLYSRDIGTWLSMASYLGNYTSSVSEARQIDIYGNVSSSNTITSWEVRTVITLTK